MASTTNWRTINIDLLDPDSAANFDTSTLVPAIAPVSASEVQRLAGQIRQLLRAGDAEGALRGALENAPYGSDSHTKDIHLASVVEVLQSIKQSDMTPLLQHIYASPSGPALLDVLMKYLYKGMSHAPPPTTSNSQHTPNAPRASSLTPQSTGFSQVHARGGGEGGGQAMSVLLSWHEKVVEMAGAGAVVRTMTDGRTV